MIESDSMQFICKTISHSWGGGGIFAHSFIPLNGSLMQNGALKTSENDFCLVFVCASLFMIAPRCIFGPGHSRPVAPRSARAL